MFCRKDEFKDQTALAEQIWQLSQAAYPAGSPWTLDQFAEDLRQENSRYLFVMADSEIVGYLSYHLIMDEAEILNVAVAPERQGQGCGKELLNEALIELIALGVQQVFLEVRISNECAKKLYEQYHFRKLGIRKRYYQHPEEDAVIMGAKVRM